MAQRAALLCLAAVLGCAPEDEAEPLAVGGGSELEVIAGAPAAGKAALRAGVQLEATAGLLASIGGVIAIGTEDGVMATALGDDAVAELSVHPDQDGPKSTGAVRQLSRRSTDGLLVLAEAGLFHAASGYLLSSPLEANLTLADVRSVTSFGSGDEEELWITASDRAYWLAAGKLTEFSLKDVAALELAVGTAPGQAVVASGGAAYFVDLGRGRASSIAGDLGSVSAATAAEDGTVYLATNAGLLARTRAGKATLWTLADSGATPVLAVAAGFGSVAALTPDGALQLAQTTATWIGSSAPQSGALAIDANGDTWSVEDGALFRYETGEPVSFASDVAPFFVEHCESCHAAGASTAPDHDFSDYEVAKEWSDSIAKRLQATDATTMPPPNTEVLTASDYAVVMRWIQSGLLP